MTVLKAYSIKENIDQLNFVKMKDFERWCQEDGKTSCGLEDNTCRTQMKALGSEYISNSQNTIRKTKKPVRSVQNKRYMKMLNITNHQRNAN